MYIVIARIIDIVIIRVGGASGIETEARSSAGAEGASGSVS